MKTSYKIAALSLLITAFAAQANAQETAEATASASATIIAPIQISKSVDMDFGDIIATTTGGTVVLGPDDTRAESGVQLPTTGAAGTAAVFKVTGTGTYNYNISLPTATYKIVNDANVNPEDVMEITDWSHDADESPALVNGEDIFKVGATLNLLPNQNPGAYTGVVPFKVNVNYN